MPGIACSSHVAPTEAAASAAVATAAAASEAGPTIAPDAAAYRVAEAGLPGIYPGATTRTGSEGAAPGPRLPGVYPGTSAAAPPAGPAGDRRLPGIYPGSGEVPEATPVDRPVAGVPTEGRFGEVATALQERFGPIDEVRQQNSVGPVVSNELIQQTFLLIIFASGAIMLYITYRFRDFRMGATAIVALIHDVIVTVGLFAVVGTLLGLQVDALFVTAMLTVIGFSVHDTIVVFDRIRENRQRYLGERLGDIANHSLMQTLGRSITTSLTLLVTLLALLVLGPDSIRSFMLVLLIGVSAGVYSSILVATPLLVDWHAYDERRKGRRVTQPSTA